MVLLTNALKAQSECTLNVQLNYVFIYFSKIKLIVHTYYKTIKQRQPQ